MKEQKLYITFYTFSEAMAIESICQEKNIEGKLVPIPRVLSSGCGVAWECPPNLEEEILKLLKEQDIEWEDYRVL